MRKRLKISNLTSGGETSSLEIIPSTLNIDPKYKNTNPGQIVYIKFFIFFFKLFKLIISNF
jgi:hypothetical protein